VLGHRASHWVVDLRQIGIVNEPSTGEQRRENHRVGNADPSTKPFREVFRVAVHCGRAKRLTVEKEQGSAAAPHNVCALSKTASKTGARSPGDELITPRTSAVAV